MMVQGASGKQKTLEHILKRIVSEGDYEAALLSDDDGLPLAVAAADEAAGMMAAMTALFRDAATQARLQLDLAHVNELSLVGDDRLRMVCRFFQTDAGQLLNLTVIVPPDRAYRRITNQAIKEINRVWTE
jgi:predicted regulator of Ras-like GTPase activity (Roadblock/LC7/MglB family)